MGTFLGARTVVYPTSPSPRLSVTLKKKRKAETAALIDVADIALDLTCS